MKEGGKEGERDREIERDGRDRESEMVETERE